MSVNRLKNIINFIENKDNLFSGFSHVMNNCVIAVELKNQLWINGEIGDNESLAISERIAKAKRNAIEVHKAFVIKTLSKNPNHTVETIVSSVYNDIYD